MSNLGSFFPPQDRRNYVNRQLKPGTVIYLHCNFTTPPKEKYLLIACWNTNPLLFIINSKIHPYIAARPELLKCQIRMSVANYGFLAHDSYVNCSEVIDSLNRTEVEEQILADINRIKGELDQAIKHTIMEAVQGSKTISPIYKKLIVGALSS